ncbi:hypothetical protein Krac_8368 [Ktedonobacter racemifer DSM 44963]|uniref:Uncharacterized protein n=1 Tax=Ktedonobacter racemifer DSM 44963 TaxID=485913 RepID=D6TMP7_KTERA|nr:hypothetical protein Krac_8368 [Ktedonobacter racemifer DSM 44963]
MCSLYQPYLTKTPKDLAYAVCTIRNKALLTEKGDL